MSNSPIKRINNASTAVVKTHLLENHQAHEFVFITALSVNIPAKLVSVSLRNRPREIHAISRTAPWSSPKKTDEESDSLERLRRGFALRLDALGHFWIGDEIVEHPKIIQLLRRGFDLSENGEPIVRVQEQWTYLEVEDCIFRARHVEAQFSSESSRPIGFLLLLDDQRIIPLSAESLWAETKGALRCTAMGQNSRVQLSVRFNNRAQIEIAEYFSEDSRTGDIMLNMFPKSVNISDQSQRLRPKPG